MISREDFIFSVGFHSDAAIVDVSARRVFGRLATLELAKKGLFKAAVASAFYKNDENELGEVLSLYNKVNEKPLGSVDSLKRTFGVLETFDRIDKVIRV